jgi:hypothetical protein
MQAARSGLKLLRAIALCSFSLCAAAAVYMSAAEQYDDALARLQNSAGIFIVFIIVVIGIILALASFVSNLLVGRSSRDDRVLLAMKLKECVNATAVLRTLMTICNRYIVTHLAMASFLSGERAFGHPGDIFESSLWMLWRVLLHSSLAASVANDAFPFLAGSVVISCRSCGCRCLASVYRTFAAAPTWTLSARRSAAACCCCRLLQCRHWACVPLAGLRLGKHPTLPF